jgi:hypothetical protein
VKAVGLLTQIHVESAWVTTECRCQTSQSNDWSCSGAKVCESEYDLGGPNIPTCTVTQRELVPIRTLTLTVNRSDCAATAAADSRHASAYNVELRCSTEGDTLLTVLASTTTGPVERSILMTFTSDGTCPASVPTDDAGILPHPGDPKWVDTVRVFSKERAWI